MSPIQQMLLGVGAVATKTYVDDIFSINLYKGNNGSSFQSIINGIDFQNEGGLVWIKNRDGTNNHQLYDTVRGSGKSLATNNNAAFVQEGSNLGSLGLANFYSTGYRIGMIDNTNKQGDDFTNFSFRKAPGFFDVVTYTGDASSNRQIAHSLGCIPGMIIVKKLSSTYNSSWQVYHRGLNGGVNPENYKLILNLTSAETSTEAGWNDTAPTSTHFTVGINATNADTETFVAYLFAGGESTAATARSVEFDGTGDYLTSSTSSDFDLGTGDFTLEYWFYHKSDSADIIFDKRTNSDTGDFATYIDNNVLKFYAGGDLITSNTLTKNQWHHAAFVKSSGKLKLYINGIKNGGTYTDNNDYDTQQCRVSAGYNTAMEFDGKISNLRLVKGTAVYTSSFRPPTKPLTSISGTALLCCNNSSVTGTTTGTVTSTGDPTASTDSPFDDPAGFSFGDAGDQNVIKCGSYVGNNNADGPEIYLGWEPQWILIKKSSTTGSWGIIDCMRGIVTGGSDKFSIANGDNVDYDVDVIELTSTGFKITNSGSVPNSDGGTIVYMAIRRPDGYVGKPPELGTGVFAMDGASNASSTIPCFDGTFPVDFAFAKRPEYSGDWYTSARLIQGGYLSANDTSGQASSSGNVFDSNAGWGTGFHATYQSWMWKRHAGFDVVTYTGDGVSGRQISHSLNKTVEMMWVKRRETTGHWIAYHKGQNGGTTPQNYRLVLNSSDAEGTMSTAWNDTAPTSTHFTVGSGANVNADGGDFIALLFSSVDGISKVGSYTGNGSTTQTITTGFQPRFLIVKNVTDSGTSWLTLDTTRAWGSGNDYWLQLNDSAAQGTTHDYGAPVSTGFTLISTSGWSNESGKKYIYYAHA